jgi:hypothetical protein
LKAKLRRKKIPAKAGVTRAGGKLVLRGEGKAELWEKEEYQLKLVGRDGGSGFMKNGSASFILFPQYSTE